MSEATPLNLDRLIKLLKMTTSPHDGEALSAIRMANATLERSFGDWETLLKGKVTIIEDPFNSASVRPKQTASRSAPPPAQAPRPKAPPKPQPKQADDYFDYSQLGPQPKPQTATEARMREDERRRRAAAYAAQQPQTKLPAQSFSRSPTGEWCVRSDVALATGQKIDVRTRAGGVRRVEIVALYTKNNYNEWLYSFKSAAPADLGGLA